MSNMEEKISISEEKLKEVASGIEITDPRYDTNIPCPQCWTLIPISLYARMEAKYVICPNCALKMDISEKSYSISERHKLWEEWERRQKAK